jgi:hypothetical protein
MNSVFKGEMSGQERRRLAERTRRGREEKRRRGRRAEGLVGMPRPLSRLLPGRPPVAGWGSIRPAGPEDRYEIQVLDPPLVSRKD